MRFNLRTFGFLMGLMVATNCSAENKFGPFEIIADSVRSELWLSTGFQTWHFNNKLGLNGHNPGWGLDYRFSTTASVTGGKFYNSDWNDSRYLGLSWYPLSVGPLHFGVFAGLFDGYPRMMNGGAFLAAVPAISAEYNRVGVNLAIVPTIQDRLYGGISLQLKLKVY
jgi:hypothetical protein